MMLHSEVVTLGYCKECYFEISDKDNMIPDYSEIYQCSKCGYPNNIEDLWSAQEQTKAIVDFKIITWCADGVVCKYKNEAGLCMNYDYGCKNVVVEMES